MSNQRPTPEKFLQQAQEEERQAQQQRGKLKIYLGAAPGVGKTFTMLQDAMAQREQGLDVVVGVVESHGRKETEDLINKMEVLPRNKVFYHQHALAEFDFDAALARNPGLILMDEMAHTNVPGSRHSKRWQDIKELLDRGINVYTTINVQHIESLSDVVAQIVHAPIKETVPDAMIELADTIEMVDLPPEDLLKRLQEGKVYYPQQAQLAVERFFRKGNLIALRELALRTTAERVGSQVLLYRQGLGIKHVWPTREKLLVCVGPGNECIKLIRTIRRLATNLQAKWIAVYVDVAGLSQSTDLRNSAMQNLQLAEKLGAETRVLTGFDIVTEVMNFAHQQNITQIVIGKKIRSRLKEFFKKSLADEMVRQSSEIDVHIITDKRIKLRNQTVKKKLSVIAWRLYGVATVIISAISIIGYVSSVYLHHSGLLLIYLLGITIVALFGQMGPAIYASILSLLVYDYLFIEPTFSLIPGSFKYLLTLTIMLIVSMVISHLTILSRRRAEVARFVENQTTALHMLSRQLASTRGVDKLINTAVRYLEELFQSDVMVLLPEEGRLVLKKKKRKAKNLNSKEQSIAQWVFDMGEMAGFGTETLPFSDSLYMPLVTSHGTVGVLKISSHSKKIFSTDQMHLLEACANQIALALDVDQLQESQRKSEFELETDRVRSALLKTVAHDLRAPLASILSTANTQIEMANKLTPAMIEKSAREIYLQSEELSRLLNNLLQITYLEAESVKLQKEFYSLQELVALVVNLASKKSSDKPIHVHIPASLPKIPFDYALMQEVLMNLIDNAIKFTSSHTSIEIKAEVCDEEVLVSVEDEGPGLVPDEVDKLFEKFYRGRMLTSERGLGLGLAICHNVIKAHGGRIWAENREKNGAAFHFTLPLTLKT